jgi:hypothetical protein
VPASILRAQPFVYCRFRRDPPTAGHDVAFMSPDRAGRRRETMPLKQA